MITYELLGCVGLLTVWSATLLIIAAAGQDARRLWAMLRELRGGLVEGRALQTLGYHRLELVGRAGADAGRILFHDRKRVAILTGGEVQRLDGGILEVPPIADGACEIWPLAAADAFDEAGFEQAYRDALKVRGFERVLTRTLNAGDRVWVGPLANGRILVAQHDPRVWLRRAIGVSALTALLLLASAAAGTLLALSAPRFGALSTLGGALLLTHFLVAQPIGTWLRDRVLTPDRAPFRSAWQQDVAMFDDKALAATRR